MQVVMKTEDGQRLKDPERTQDGRQLMGSAGIPLRVGTAHFVRSGWICGLIGTSADGLEAAKVDLYFIDGREKRRNKISKKETLMCQSSCPLFHCESFSRTPIDLDVSVATYICHTDQ